jgi:hypothetical protein
MLTNLHKDSISGNIRGVSQTESPKTTTGESLLEGRTDQINDSPYSNNTLHPRKQKNPDNIFWNEGSYSGSDMKVVAHLYEPYNAEGELTHLREERDIASAIETGARNLSGSVGQLSLLSSPGSSTFGEKRIAFQKATGLSTKDECEQQAVRYLTSTIFDNTILSIGGLSKMRALVDNVYKESQSRRENLDARIKELMDISTKAQSTITLATLQTVSLQTYREKEAVRACGFSYAKGFTRGPRTVAGSMIFTVFNEHSLSTLIRSMSRERGVRKNTEISTFLPDQLPPIDVTIVFANEYGALSELRILGLEFVTDGMTMSIEDILTEQVMNFVCRDCDIMTSKGNILLSRLQRGGVTDPGEKETTASSLLFNNERYEEYLDIIGARRRLLNR